MQPLQIHGYVIASANGMLAGADGAMPDALKFPGDHAFFSASLDRVDLIVHGRKSFEDQPNSPKRTRIILSHTVKTMAPDPSNPKATLWNPAGASFEEACEQAGVRRGIAAIIGGPDVFAMFLDRYDVFFLSQAPHVVVPNGQGCFPGILDVSGAPARTPQQILADHGLTAAEVQVLDAAHDVVVTAWRRLR